MSAVDRADRNQSGPASAKTLQGDSPGGAGAGQLILAFARALFVNGQATEEAVKALERLGQALGLSVGVMPRWGAVQLRLGDSSAAPVWQTDADPTGVNMVRVAAAMHAIAQIEARRLAPQAALKDIAAISEVPPAPTWLFALAAAVGSVALSVIYGVEHWGGAALIFLSAAAGAWVRRGLAKRSSNLFIQPFSAALLAGVIGAVAVHLELSSSLRLVAVCPCMVLVPGPQFLNGMMDFINGRIHLGAARLVHAFLVVVAISAGLLLGLSLLGASLPIAPAGRAVPLWQDMLAAGTAVFAFSVFFSTPMKMLPWPVAVGMLAHAVRWVALSVFGMGVAPGALVAGIVVGLILAPISRRRHMPFAAIGFAAVVSLFPGVYLFRMISGLLQIAFGVMPSLDLIGATLVDGTTALVVILAMGIGLVVPKMITDHWARSVKGVNER